VNVPPPTPLACVALAAALPLVPVAGAWIAARATRDRATQALMAPVAGVALWLVSIIVLARLAHAFVPGVVGGTLLVAALGAAHGRAWLRAPRARLAGLRRPGLLFAAAAVLAIVPAVRAHFHDELLVGGHMSLVAQLENGVFPLRFATFPQFELPYHVGFDVLAAALGVIFRLPTALAIDAVTLLSFVAVLLLAGRLGRVLGGARAGLLTSLLALFGGGVHLLCPAPGAPLGHHLIGYCEVDHVWLNPPLGSYLFQHPFNAGIPLFLAVILLLADRASGPRPARYALFGLLFLALSQCQMVLFACGLGAFLVAEPLPRGRLDRRRALGALAAALLAVAAALPLGGFFAAQPYRDGPSLELHLGIATTLAGTLAWHARSYGLLLPLGLLGLWHARRERLFLALLVGGALLVPNVVRYKHTWDIVKFATVATLALALCTGVLFTRLLRAGKGPRPLRVALVAVLAAGCVAWSATFHAAAWLHTPKTSFEHAPEPIDADDAVVIAHLRRVVGADEGVYRSLEKAKAYNQWGGLATPFPEEVVRFFGFSPRLVQPRKRLLSVLPPSVGEWTREGIVWLVLSPNDVRLRAYARTWVKDGAAEIALEQGDLRLVHLRRQ
jgi:hypothetical protein